MTIFLTSSPTGDLDGKYQVLAFDTRNDFLDELTEVWPENARVLIITAAPEDHESNDVMRDYFAEKCEVSGLPLECFDLLDSRCEDISEEELCSYDVIFFGGGHVPTQNAFLHEYGIPEKIQNFDGIVIGISAGSMNCADWVYSVPEMPGESEDPDYDRVIPGLGITDINILPHYQIVKDQTLDGKRIYDEIILPDSIGEEFVALPDGSYIEIRDGEPRIFGEHYFVIDGEFIDPSEGEEEWTPYEAGEDDMEEESEA